MTVCRWRPSEGGGGRPRRGPRAGGAGPRGRGRLRGLRRDRCGRRRPALDGWPLVVHTAAIVTEWGEMDEFRRVNVGGTRNVTEGRRGTARVVQSPPSPSGDRLARELHEDEPARPCATPTSTQRRVRPPGRRQAPRSCGPATSRPARSPGPSDLQGPEVRPARIPGGGEGLITPVYVDDPAECACGADRPDGEGGVFTAWSGEPCAAQFFGHNARMLGKPRCRRCPTRWPAAPPLEAEELGPRHGPAAGCHPLGALSKSDAGTSTYSTARTRERPRLGAANRLWAEGMRRTEAWFREEGLLPAAG